MVKMKYLYMNKYWELNKDYDIDKILYLMIDRPYIIVFDEDFVWYNNNKNQYHREYDFPSYIEIYYNNLCGLRWYENDKRHRENGKPANISCNGYKSCYIHGKLIKTK